MANDELNEIFADLQMAEFAAHFRFVFISFCNEKGGVNLRSSGSRKLMSNQFHMGS